MNVKMTLGRRRMNVKMTLGGRRMNVKMTLCAYWEANLNLKTKTKVFHNVYYNGVHIVLTGRAAELSGRKYKCFFF